MKNIRQKQLPVNTLVQESGNPQTIPPVAGAYG